MELVQQVQKLGVDNNHNVPTKGDIKKPSVPTLPADV